MKRKPRGFIRVRQIQRGKRFYAYISHEGQEVSLGGFSSQDRAETALRTAENEIAQGTFGIKPSTNQKYTFAEFYETWIASKEKALKPSTLKDYRLTFQLHILPTFAEKLLSDIKPDDVQEWINSLHLSPATTAKCYRYFRVAMRQAETWELIPKHPCRGITLPRVVQPEVDFLTPPEIARVLEHLREPERTFTATLAYSGMRTGEVLALRWKDVDLENRVINVTRSWNRHNGFDTPKSSASRRAVPILPHLEGILSEHFHRQGSPSPETLLFFVDGKPVDVRRRFETALKAAGLRPVNIHSLRHGFASLLLSHGVSIKAVQRCLGHGSAALTLSVYSHLIRDDLGSAALAVNASISGGDEKVIPLAVAQQ